MPYANIQLTSKGVICEEKKRWIAGVTKQLTEAFGKNPKLIHVVIQEVSTDDRGSMASKSPKFAGRKNPSSTQTPSLS